MIYISLDGDSVGRKIESYILSGQLDELRNFNIEFSNLITNTEKIFTEYNAIIYLKGGDNILAKLPKNNIKNLLKDLTELLSSSEISFSLGMGKSIEECYLALKHAKVVSKTSKLTVTRFDFHNKVTIL